MIWFGVVVSLNIIAFVIAKANLFFIKSENVSDSSLFATLMSSFYRGMDLFFNILNDIDF